MNLIRKVLLVSTFVITFTLFQTSIPLSRSEVSEQPHNPSKRFTHTLTNIARRKPARVLEASSSLASYSTDSPANDGFLRPITAEQTPFVVNGTRGEVGWEVDLLEPSLVEEILIVLGPSYGGQQVSVKVTLLEHQTFGEKEIATLKVSTSVGVIFLQKLDYSNVRYVRVSPLEDALLLEELEVYGRQETAGDSEKEGEGKGDESSRINLVVTYFKGNDATRHAEIVDVLRRNLRNPFIDRVLVLSESCENPEARDELEELSAHNKLTLECQPLQPTYADIFRAANKHFGGEIVIVSNADIIFTDALRHLKTPGVLKLTESFILARWAPHCEVPESPFSRNRCWAKKKAYDSYILRAPVREDILSELNFVSNRFAAAKAVSVAFSKQYTLSNPCMDLPLIHSHCTDVREWRADKNVNQHVEAKSAPKLPSTTLKYSFSQEEEEAE